MHQKQKEHRLYLLIHTMTIADYDFIVQAQFFHTLVEGSAAGNPRLIGRRVSMRTYPALRRDRNKAALQRLRAPSLDRVMKRNSAVVKHHLRTIHIAPEHVKAAQNSQNVDGGFSQQQNLISHKNLTISAPQSPEKRDESTNDSIGNDTYNVNQLTQFSNPDETVRWLTIHRFEKYLDVFSRFSGSDMLRMSREDFIQICGHADGIRLHNALHLKAIAPKLKLYICRENVPIFNAIFLSSHSHLELVQQLCSMASISQDQVRGIYMEGPQSIHVQVNDDVLRHVEEDSMFSLSVLPENGTCVFLLRRKAKQP